MTKLQQKIFLQKEYVFITTHSNDKNKTTINSLHSVTICGSDNYVNRLKKLFSKFSNCYFKTVW